MYLKKKTKKQKNSIPKSCTTTTISDNYSRKLHFTEELLAISCAGMKELIPNTIAIAEE